MIVLSIIIPMYNVEKYINRCLDSICSQITDKVEVIILNDGSTDNSKRICENYKNKNVIVIDKKNEGCSKTRNRGIEKAKGKYIWFIDADDFIEKNSIEKVMNIILEKEVDIILFGCSKIKGKDSQKFIPSQKRNTKIKIYNDPDIFNGVCTKIYNASIIKKNNLKFNILSQMGEDLAFNFKFFYYVERYCILEEALYNYLDTGGATSNLEKRIGIYYSFDEIVDFFKKNNSFEEMREILKNYYKLHAIKIPYNFIMYQSTKQSFDKKVEIKKIGLEIKKREKFFNSNFYLLQLICTLKMKIYFIRPIYRKILKLMNGR